MSSFLILIDKSVPTKVFVEEEYKTLNPNRTPPFFPEIKKKPAHTSRARCGSHARRHGASKTHAKQSKKEAQCLHLHPSLLLRRDRPLLSPLLPRKKKC